MKNNKLPSYSKRIEYLQTGDATHEIACRIKNSNLKVIGAEKWWLIIQFKDFLNQPLNISMFVPAIFEGGKWVVLEKPYEGQFEIEVNTKCSGWAYLKRDKEHGDFRYYDKIAYLKAVEQYKTALDNVIFEGFTSANTTKNVYQIYDNNYRLVFNKKKGTCLDGTTIQDLIKYSPTLTAKGLKDSGIN